MHTEIFSYLKNHNVIGVRQRRELAELLGFETRNKYEIHDSQGNTLGYAAEKRFGWLDFFVRQWFGHWRRFEIQIFDSNRNLQIVARHPFRWFFQRIDVATADGKSIGFLQQRFGLLTKKFDFYGYRGELLFEMRSGFFRIWSFPIFNQGRKVGMISKKWAGLLQEAFLDADTFRVEVDATTQHDHKLLILTGALFVDLLYFENKVHRRGSPHFYLK